MSSDPYVDERPSLGQRDQRDNRVGDSRALAVASLAIGCLGCLAMIVLRAFIRERFEMRSMVWNLFLAVVPVPVAWLVDAFERRGTSFVLLVLPILVWLGFFPNAPYLVTDLIHLKPTRGLPLWYDGLVFFAFAATGLMLGLTSLYLVQAAIDRRFGRRWGWPVALVAMAASGYGIYLGRVERWNTWDVITRPGSLASSVSNQVKDPLSNRQAIALTVGFTVFLATVYLILRAFAHLVVADDRSDRS